LVSHFCTPRKFICSLKLASMSCGTQEDGDSMGRAVLLEGVDSVGDEGGAVETMRMRTKEKLAVVRVQMKRLGTA